MAQERTSKQWLEVAKWLLIVLLSCMCAVVYVGKQSAQRERDIVKEDAYIKIYDSQTIEALKKQNRELYDSVTALNGRKPESALQIRYRYVTKTDTITKTKFIQTEDSVYHYTQDNDTIRTEIDVKAKDLQWCKTSTIINDQFTIITRKGDDGSVETTVGHSPNVDITGVDAWHAKPTFRDRITFGPTFGVGYGIINSKFDIYIGFSVGYKIQ